MRNEILWLGRRPPLDGGVLVLQHAGGDGRGGWGSEGVGGRRGGLEGVEELLISGAEPTVSFVNCSSALDGRGNSWAGEGRVGGERGGKKVLG